MQSKGVLRQILAPFRYYQFFNRGKMSIDVIWPAMFSIMTCALFACVPGGVALLGDHGFVTSINGLLQLLTGFFVAGLAAVFGVRGPSLEQEPIGFTFLGSLKRDRLAGVAITRRMFVCSLFAYLAFVSFAIYLAGLFATVCLPLIRLLTIPIGIHYVISFLYVFFIWNIFFVTSYGFYYMVDRAHRAEPEIVDGPIDDDDET